MTIHWQTPLVESLSFSRRLGKDIHFKMEAAQPTGSFKARGVGHACTIHRDRGARRFISSSGGNAGLAVAHAGRKLGVPVVVVVPNTTSERAKTMIGLEMAEVVVHGSSWAEANERALSMLSPTDAFIHPFDDPLLWTGHATLVDELRAQGGKPDAIVLSVGGGGLLCGVAEGLDRNGWSDVPIVAVETQGADSFARAVAAGRPVTLPSIDSIATSLGAKTVSDRALEVARSHRIEPVVVSDAEAVDACLRLMDQHRVVVEPACGASLAALTRSQIISNSAGRIVVVVCGGVGASAEDLFRWRDGFATLPTTLLSHQ
ncbi:serine dehydratase (plasmid) [Azospirillum humicireducens]|uniref:L-serine ammonia-lyase n=1 Tax=Azospirillum humicireducens TaxID=1226968 RepID=A0A2R4VRX0_9PROT|nr:pyridoxal-phosphate dependent enzyme [Azospirillum humicireducens]AWB07198.1 serine dehydratase [Azospirillum humicireducens]